MNKTITISLLALAAAIAIAGGVFLHFGKQAAPLAPPAPRPAVTTIPQAAAPAPAATPAPAPIAAPVDCVKPAPDPAVPSGATASEADMSSAHDAIQAFVLKLEAFQACRDSQADHASMLFTQATKQRWEDEGDAAVDEAHALANAYAAQLTIFKARPQPPAAAH